MKVEPGRMAKQSKTMIQSKPSRSQKTHVFGLLGAASVINLRETFVTNSMTSDTTVICKSQHGSFYRIKKDFFSEKLHSQENVVRAIKKRCMNTKKQYTKDVRKMQKSNIHLEDELKKLLVEQKQAKDSNNATENNIIERT
jgi:hypothetical protein